MARIPRLLAAQGISSPEGPQIPQYAGSGLTSAVSEAGYAVAGAASQAALLEQRKKEEAIKSEADLIGSDIEMQVNAGDVQLRSDERDPDAYTTKYEALVQDALERARKNAKHPESAKLAEAKTRRALVRMRVESYKHANGLWLAEQQANDDQALENEKVLAGVAVDDAVFRTHLENGQAIHARQATRIGREKAEDNWRKWRESVLDARALKEANEDPETFVATADVRFAMLDAKKREQLKKSALDQIESNRKSYNAEMEKYFKGLEDAEERERQSQLTDLTSAAERGSLTIRQLDDAKAMRIVQTPSEYRTLHKAITEQKETVSDQTTLDNVQLRSRAPIPRITTGEIDALYLAGKLSRKDWLEEKGHVDKRIDYLRTEGRTERSQKLAQAEQVLKADMGLGSLIDKWDDQDKALYARALDELTTRSFQGEDPLAAGRDIGTRYGEIRSSRVKLKVDEYRTSLPIEVRGQTSDDAMKALGEAIKSGRYTDQSAAPYKRTILDWKRREAADEEAKKKQGGNKSLRDKKPESGKE